MAALCCMNGERLIQRSAKRKYSGAEFPNPTQNSMVRENSKQHWDAMLSDVKSGCWQAVSREIAAECQAVADRK